MRKVMIALVLLMAAPVWVEDVARQITVVGHATVDTVPDMATISMGVVTETMQGGAPVMMLAGNMDAVRQRSVPMAEGEVTVGATVTVVFAINVRRLSVSP